MKRQIGLRPMLPRDPEEAHRAATPLELFFDLCFVVAIALAADNLHHAIVEDHLDEALLRYCLVFFAIWWAWVNFTWFASAYDTDDGPYRIATFVQMSGALIIAAGVPRTFENGDFLIMVIGYVIMRSGLISLWLRASRAGGPLRATAQRYAIGLVILQAAWAASLLLPVDDRIFAIVPLIAGELIVPVWAEAADETHTQWHPGHIAERYGLFTLIVLGESVLAATLAFQVALDEGHSTIHLVTMAIAALVLIFSCWWLYFDRQRHDRLTSLKYAFTWGYGHWFIFASLAAIGAGIAATIDYKTDHSALNAVETGYAVAFPAAIYVLSVWTIQVLPFEDARARVLFPIAAALLLLAPLAGFGIYLVAGVMAAFVTIDEMLRGDPPQAEEA